MNPFLRQKVNKIAKYAKSNYEWINKLIVFGEVLDDDSEMDVIEFAVEFNDAFDTDECFDDLVTVIDDISEGMFDLLLMNGDNLTPSVLSEIEKGEIIYERKKAT